MVSLAQRRFRSCRCARTRRTLEGYSHPWLQVSLQKTGTQVGICYGIALLAGVQSHGWRKICEDISQKEKFSEILDISYTYCVHRHIGATVRFQPWYPPPSNLVTPLPSCISWGFLTRVVWQVEGVGLTPHHRPVDQASVGMSPGDRMVQLYPQTLGIHFNRLLRHAWTTLGLFLFPATTRELTLCTAT